MEPRPNRAQSPSMSDTVEYANWWSRLLCHDAFDRQFFIPVPPPRAVTRGLEAIERVCFPARRLAGLRVEKPVFVVGLPRSGTTMLYNLLCSHEQAAYVTNSMNVYPSALIAIERLRVALKLDIRGERYLKDSVYTAFGGPSELMTLWGKWTGRRVEDLDWESHPVALTPAMRAQAHEDFARVLYAFGPQATRIISKNPVLQPELLTIQALFPDARFIHIVRDGRMVANSLVKLYRLNNQQLLKIRHPQLKTIVPYPKTRHLQGFMADHGPDTLACTSRVWADTLRLVDEVAPALDHFLEIRYEDLLAEPEAQTRRLFAFCDLPWPAADNRAFGQALAGVGTIHHENRYGDFDVVEAIAGEALARHGYGSMRLGR